MEYVAAYSLIVKNSSEELSSEVLKSKIINLMNAIQAPICEESLDLFLSKINGKSFSELIASGSELMKSQIATSASNTGAAAVQTEAKVEAVEESDSSNGDAMDFF